MSAVQTFGKKKVSQISYRKGERGNGVEEWNRMLI
jgi:hypothetical protein